MPLLTLHDPTNASRYYEKGLWREEGLYDYAAHHARTNPNDFALRDSRNRLTWQEVVQRSCNIAHVLAGMGLKTGDRVAMGLSNRVEAPLVLLACSRNGYVCTPSLHRNYSTAEMLTLVNEIDAAAVISEKGWSADKGDLAKLIQTKNQNRVCFSLSDDRTLAEEFSNLESEGNDGASPQLGADKVCYLAFTSGTTGRAKGVMHSDNTLLANARDLVTDWQHDRSTVLLSLSPLSHHIAWVGLAQALIGGSEFVINDPPRGMTTLDWLCEANATYVMGVPTHAIDLLQEQRERRQKSLGMVKVFYMAGAPIPRSIAECFLAQGIVPQNVYGMTENSSHQYTHPEDDTDIIVSSCGRGGRAYEVRIFNPEDRDKSIGMGQVGEIGGRGAALMLGYFNDQGSTEKSFNKDGWFMSGDLGRIDASGNLEVVGRSKDIIIRGGRNIHPRKIEDLVLEFPGIQKAAAIPVPDRRLGEKVCLVILSDGGRKPDSYEVLNFLYASGLSIYDMPEYYAVSESFPLTASGKILKRALIAEVKQGTLVPVPVRFKVDNHIGDEAVEDETDKS